MERLTKTNWRNLDPWECCGQDSYCQRGCHDIGGCTKGCVVPQIYHRLAAYEDTGLSPEGIKALRQEKCIADEKEKAAEPVCKVGDEVYQTDGIRIYASRIKNVMYDCGAIAFDKAAIGRSVFFTLEEAERAIKNGKDGD